MPKVPSYDSLQTNAPQLPDARLSAGVISPDAMATAGNQAKQLGQAELTASDAAASIFSGMEHKANVVRETDGYNQLVKKGSELKFGTLDNPSSGYLSQKGQAALDPDANGKHLGQRVSEQLQETIDQISSSLGNEQQRQMFAQHANAYAARFNAELQAHQMQEFQNYRASTYSASAELAGQQAVLNWDKPDLINNTTKDQAGNDQPSYVDQVKQGIQLYGEARGMSATEISLKQQQAESHLHAEVIEAALKNGDPTYANSYMQQYKNKLTNPNDLLRVNGDLTRTLNDHMSQLSVHASTQKYMNQFSPPDMTRLGNIIQGMESGGKDFNPDGTPVTSAKGAKYAMQVMPATAANPGFGIQPAKDNSPAEYNRVGNEYLGAMVKKYGNPAMVMAAYNAGPGLEGTSGYSASGKPLPGLAPAMARAKSKGTPENWLAELPAETQAYVQKGMSKLNSGGGAPALPTELEFVNDAVSRLGPNPSPELVSSTTTAAQRQFGIITKSRHEQADQSLGDAQRALAANGFNFAALDPQLKSNLLKYDPDNYTKAMKFADAGAAPDAQTNMSAYNAAITYPSELAKMTDAQFLQFQKTNFSAADQLKVAKWRADQMTGKAATSIDNLDTKALNDALANRLTAVGRDVPTKKSSEDDRQWYGSLQKFAADDIYARQQYLGRPMTQKEIGDRVDQLMVQSVPFRTMFMGLDVGSTSQNLLTMHVSDIPPDSLSQLKTAFSQRGVTAPTKDQLLRAYWRAKQAH